MKTKKHLFFTSFFISIIIFFTLIAMVYVDYICRKNLTGITTFPFTISNINEQTLLNIKSFGLDTNIDISNITQFFKGLLDLLLVN